jgi:hypothetical protein
MLAFQHYLLNNSYEAIGNFDQRRNERPNRDSIGGDKLFRNEDNKFIDVSEQAGIYGSVIGFGLGITIGDINQDGWQDIYISNDFFERDYLYMNNQDGTFAEVLESSIRSISAASMGADMADINNDALPDIFVTDMLPEPDSRVKTVTSINLMLLMTIITSLQEMCCSSIKGMESTVKLEDYLVSKLLIGAGVH